jgi:hypothetical protein
MKTEVQLNTHINPFGFTIHEDDVIELTIKWPQNHVFVAVEGGVFYIPMHEVALVKDIYE